MNAMLTAAAIFVRLMPAGPEGTAATSAPQLFPPLVTPCLATSDKHCYRISAFPTTPQIIISGPIKNSCLIAERLYIHYEWSRLLQVSTVRDDGEITPVDTIQMQEDWWTEGRLYMEPEVAYFGTHGELNDRLLAVYEYPSVQPDFQMRPMPQVCKVYSGDTLEYRIEPRFESIKVDPRAERTMEAMALKCQGDHFIWIAHLSVFPFRMNDKVVYLSIFHKDKLTDLCIAHDGDEPLQTFKDLRPLRAKRFELTPSHEDLTISITPENDQPRTFTIREWIKVPPAN